MELDAGLPESMKSTIEALRQKWAPVAARAAEAAPAVACEAGKPASWMAPTYTGVCEYCVLVERLQTHRS